MRATGYERYLERIEELRTKGYRIKEKDIKDKNVYELSAWAHNNLDEVKSHNMPRDMARRAATLSPKQIANLRGRHPGLKHLEMRGLGLTDYTILNHFPELTVEELRNLTPEELQAKLDAIKVMRKQEGYSSPDGSP